MDLIRALAIFLVIMLHAAYEPITIVNQMSPEGVTLWWTVNVYNSLSRPCVPLFIMLAGALLLQPQKVGEPLGVFFKKRANRIALPFLFWGAAYFAWRFFVHGEALSAGSIVQGVLTGPYVHFWFLYLLMGLYLITPVLRVVLAYAGRKILKYFLLIWFVGTAIVSLPTLFGQYILNANVFLLTGWLGYFVLGAYLVKARLRHSVLYLTLVLGYLWTMIGTYLAVGTIGERVNQFFYDSFSFNVIMASAALFLLLLAVQPQKLESRFPHANSLLHQISQNTLSIFLFHIMVLETLQNGYLGFKISLTTVNPLLELPLITIVTLFICLGLIIPLKKIPYLRRLIG